MARPQCPEVGIGLKNSGMENSYNRKWLDLTGDRRCIG